MIGGYATGFTNTQLIDQVVEVNDINPFIAVANFVILGLIFLEHNFTV